MNAAKALARTPWVLLLAVGSAVAATATGPSRPASSGETLPFLRMEQSVELPAQAAPVPFESGRYWVVAQADGSAILQIEDPSTGQFHVARLPKPADGAAAKAASTDVALEALEAPAGDPARVWALWNGGIGAGELRGFLLKRGDGFEISLAPR